MPATSLAVAVGQTRVDVRDLALQSNDSFGQDGRFGYVRGLLERDSA